MLKSFKPGIPKRYLLLVAGLVWTMAGLMLIIKGVNYVFNNNNYISLRIAIALIIGFAFYLALFARISLKHLNRIKAIDIVKPCIFSFFNFRSYALMVIMISFGIILRKINLINPGILYTFYIGMGIPLLISAFRFYYAWFKYKDVLSSSN